MKIVQYRSHNGLRFAVRTEGAAGIETEIFSSKDRKHCEGLAEKLEAFLSADREKLSRAVVGMAASLLMIAPIVDRIASTSDQAGEKAYATKTHMRLWASECHGLAIDALTETGLCP